MSTNSVGTLSIDLELNDSAFDRALANASGKAAAAGNAIDKELAGATSRTEARFASFGSIATKALTVTGLAAGVAGFAAVKMAGDFQQSLNVFQSVSGATAKQMELVAQKARELGQDASLPGISARDAAAALTELAKAGLTVNDSLAASKGVLSLAKAGNLDVADAATIAARALNAFGLQGSEAARVADLLAAAANASSSDVSGIALGLAQVGSGAKQMGVNLQDTVTSLALFTNAGVQGQDAGTSLKQMFIQLATPTKQASELMKKLGIDFFDAKGNFIGLATTGQVLQDKLKGLTTEQKNNALATIFGSDSMRVAAILADQGAAGFNKMATAVGKQGAATELAAAQNAGFNGALDNFISTIQTVAIDLGTKVLPPLTNFLKVMSSNLPGAIDVAVTAFAPVVSVLSGLAVAFVAVKVGMFIVDLQKASLAATGLGKALLFLQANPIILAISAIIAVLIFLQLKFNIAGKSAAFLGDVFRDASTVVRLLFDALTGGDPTLKASELKFKGFVQALLKVRDAITGFISTGVDVLKKGLSELNDAFTATRSFLVDHRKGLEQIVGVLTILLGPALVKLAVTATIRGAQIAASGIAAAAGWVLGAARMSVAWAVEFAKMAGGAVANAAVNLAQAAVAGAAWLLNAAKMSAIWLFNFGIMTAQAVGTAVVFVAQSIIAGYAWVVRATIASVAWLIQFAIMSAGAIATATVFVVQSAIAGGAWLIQAAKAAGPWLIQFAIMSGQAIATAVVFLAQAALSAGAWIASAAAAAIPWLISFALMVAGAVATAASFVAAGVAAGVAWLLALGPIGLIIAAVAAVIAIVALVIANWSRVKDFFLGLFGAIGKAVVDFVGTAIGLGANVVAGIAKGISDGAGAVINKIKDICGQSLDAVKKFFGIHSPSTVMAGIGENLMKGLAEGIANAGSLATDAMTGVSSGLQSALTVPSGSFSLSADGAGIGAAGGRTQNFNNVYNVYNGTDATAIATEQAWRAQRA